MRITAIDIGTNTILMVIADLREDGRIHTLRDEIAFPRLGKGVDNTGIISPDTIERVLSVMRGYKRISDSMASDRIIACGTSALRDARNRDDLIRRISEEVAIETKVLTGDEEAIWTFAGAITEFDDKNGPFAVIDIGGGSTEITLGSRHGVERKVSLDLGCVRLTERFLSSAPPSQRELDAAGTIVRQSLMELGDADGKKYKLVGVAGTATTLAALDQQLQEFDGRAVSGYALSLERIESIFERLRCQTIEEIRSSPVVPEGRADVLLAGVLILKELMFLYHFDQLTVSSRGLRYGLLLREFEGMKRLASAK